MKRNLAGTFGTNPVKRRILYLDSTETKSAYTDANQGQWMFGFTNTNLTNVISMRVLKVTVETDYRQLDPFFGNSSYRIQVRRGPLGGTPVSTSQQITYSPFSNPASSVGSVVATHTHPSWQKQEAHPTFHDLAAMSMRETIVPQGDRVQLGFPQRRNPETDGRPCSYYLRDYHSTLLTSMPTTAKSWRCIEAPQFPQPDPFLLIPETADLVTNQPSALSAVYDDRLMRWVLLYTRQYTTAEVKDGTHVNNTTQCRIEWDVPASGGRATGARHLFEMLGFESPIDFADFQNPLHSRSSVLEGFFPSLDAADAGVTDLTDDRGRQTIIFAVAPHLTVMRPFEYLTIATNKPTGSLSSNLFVSGNNANILGRLPIPVNQSVQTFDRNSFERVDGDGGVLNDVVVSLIYNGGLLSPSRSNVPRFSMELMVEYAPEWY